MDLAAEREAAGSRWQDTGRVFTTATGMFDGGVLEAFAEGAVWAQMGTIGVAATAQVESRLRQRRPDLLFVDALVSGSKGAAEAGQLPILASGPPRRSRWPGRRSPRSAARPCG